MQTRLFSPLDRRAFLVQSGLIALGAKIGLANTSPPKRILLRSSWQTVNIGDIAHTPGVLALLEKHMPEAEIHLWPSLLDNGVEALLRSRFPKLRIAADPAALRAAFESCDFLLHSSGASFVAEKDVLRWHEETGKPFGVYGITLSPKKSSNTEATPETVLAETIRVLGQGQFVFFRDSRSLDFAKEKGCACPIMEFGPDGAFACDLRDDTKAEAFLAKHNLDTEKFLCCIPRLRYTPYWWLPEKKRALDPDKRERNEEMKEHDHAPLRRAIVDVVTQTDLKVLLCPEDKTQMRVGKELLYDKLPASVRERVVWRSDYWLTGEAISTYVRSAGLFGNEMHSPIMAVGHGVPAIVCRWAEQTTKGYMWEDIGLSDWLFDLDDEDQVARVAATVLEMAKDPAAARSKAEKAQRFVQKRQTETMARLSLELA